MKVLFDIAGTLLVTALVLILVSLEKLFDQVFNVLFYLVDSVGWLVTFLVLLLAFAVYTTVKVARKFKY